MTGRIPFDRVFSEALVHGLPVTVYGNGKLKGIIGRVWDNFITNLNLS